jgi:gliding motility-associated-like protein
MTYYVRVIERGCKSNFRAVLITVAGATKIYAPNSFTPKVTGLISNYSLKIYNRFGTLVFQSNDHLKSWDGKLNGISAPSGEFRLDCKWNRIGIWVVIHYFLITL